MTDKQKEAQDWMEQFGYPAIEKIKSVPDRANELLWVQPMLSGQIEGFLPFFDLICYRRIWFKNGVPTHMESFPLPPEVKDIIIKTKLLLTIQAD